MSAKISQVMRTRSLLLYVLAYCTILLLAIVQQQSNASDDSHSKQWGKLSHSNSSANALARLKGSRHVGRLLDAVHWRAPSFKQFKSNFGRRYESGLEESVRRRMFAARVVEAARSVWRYLSRKSETYKTISSRSDMTPEERRQLLSQRPKQLVDERLLEGGKIVLMDEPEKHQVGMSRGGLANLVGDLFDTHQALASASKISWYSRLTGGTKAASGGQTKDLRLTKCFGLPGDQGACESCASFVAMSQLEYLHCRETGNLVKFSEQFPVDCGSQFGMMGCRGTDVASLNQFIAIAGLELADTYPYTGSKSRCPYYNKLTRAYAWEQAGNFKLRHTGLAASTRTSWSKYLALGIPLHVGVLTSDAFEDYGGGVASTCSQESGAHGMLLIGEGREHGQDYWLLRNSYGADWGEEGYFRLSKRATECFSDEGRGYFQQAFTQSMGDSFVPNKWRVHPAA